MLPADEGFEAHDLSRFDIDDGLILQEELVALDCLLSLHAQQQEAERLANAPPPRRSSRRRKRAAQTNESGDEEARVGPAARRARC